MTIPSDKSPVEKMVEIDFSQASPGDIYRLMAGAIVPRPIAFVSTINAQGVGNLAPFSFYNGVSSDPPCLVLSVTYKRGGALKDTLRNILENRQFVVNSVAEWMAGPMHQCSADYPYGVDEMAAVGLTPLPSRLVKPFRVKEAPVQMECELYKTVEIGEKTSGATVLVIGRILMMHVYDAAYRDGQILADAIKPLSRLGGASYGLTSGAFDMARPRL
jgi:flavin reductase (DIM6/NTAB) family NADH-FMN oxidoreductase RutF